MVIHNQYGQAIPEVYVSTNKGTSGAINIDYAPAFDFRLLNITIHLSASTNDDLTVILDSIDGAEYDAKLLNQADSFQDLVWVPNEPLFFKSGDQIDIDCANSGNATYGVRIVVERI